jgi:hypothetical protein
VNPSEREALQALLPLVALGMASAQERAQVQAALEGDAELRAEFEAVKLALSGMAAPVAPRPELRARVLEAARVKPSASKPPRVQLRPRQRRRPFPRALAGIFGAVFAAVFALVLLLPRGSSGASVVATTADGGLIVARSGRTSAMLEVVRPDRRRLPVTLTTARASQFTDGVSSGGVSYLLDAGNSRLYLVNETSGAVMDDWPVPDGAAGVAVDGSTVVVKGARSGTLALFNKTGQGEKTMLEARLAPSTALSSADLMDSTLIEGDVIYATHHMTGEVSAVDRRSGRVVERFKGLGAPVALARDGDGLLVLDHAGGRLLRLSPAGAVARTLETGGRPDRLSVMDGVAYLSDRAGTVTAVNLERFAVAGRTTLSGTPMDLAPMPGDHLAVALEHRGVVVLNSALQPIETID